MYPEEGRSHQFLYHAYALALGGWFRDKNGQLTSLPSIAPSVLSITGGYGAACEKNVNFTVDGSAPFGEGGPRGFHLFVGQAYSEVRGDVREDKNALGQYVTTVRSILDNVRINDDFYVEHAEAILESRHDVPGINNDAPEAEVVVGDSNMFGVHVRGQKVGFERRAKPDHYARYNDLRRYVDGRRPKDNETLATPQQDAFAELSEDDRNWVDDLCDWYDPDQVPQDVKYARDIAKMNHDAKNHLRYSLFKNVTVPVDPATGIKGVYKSSIDVKNFGRIFLGEVIASHGMKQVHMFRIDLGCDTCGGVGGSGGTTNGGPMP